MRLDDVDLTIETVRTERLVLRPYRPDDVDAVYRACLDPDIHRWIPLPTPYTRADAEQFVGVATVSARQEKRAMLTAVEADGTFVGSAGVHFPTSLLGPAVGYWLAPWGRGRGYAAEAARELAEWAFRHGALRAHLFADLDNPSSQAVARRAGFTREGVVRSCLPYRDGTRGDAVLFGRLAGE